MHDITYYVKKSEELLTKFKRDESLRMVANYIYKVKRICELWDEFATNADIGSEVEVASLLCANYIKRIEL